MTPLDNQNPVGSGSQTLSQLLDSIEERARTSQGYNFTSIVKLDVPALVKALRRANEIISECDPDTVTFWRWEVTAILEDRADVGEEKQNLREQEA